MSHAPNLVVKRHEPVAEGAACSTDGACAQLALDARPAALDVRATGPDEQASSVGLPGGLDQARPGRTPLVAGLAAAVACLACLVPGLAAGGAGVLAVGSLGADELVMGGLALILLAIAGITWARRRRRRAAGAACGC